MTAQVQGTNRRFWAEAQTSAPDEVWRLWTTPATWGEWDRGLRAAELGGPFDKGARGRLTDLAGRRSRFVVTDLLPGQRCRYQVSLPAARLELHRTLSEGPTPTVRHEVAFIGPLAVVWARVLGPGFRRQLGPTVDELVRLAEDAYRGGSAAPVGPARS